MEEDSSITGEADPGPFVNDDGARANPSFELFDLAVPLDDLRLLRMARWRDSISCSLAVSFGSEVEGA